MPDFTAIEWVDAIYQQPAPLGVPDFLPAVVGLHLQRDGVTDREFVAESIRAGDILPAWEDRAQISAQHVDQVIEWMVAEGFFEETFVAPCPRDHDHNAATCQERVLEFRLPREIS